MAGEPFDVRIPQHFVESLHTGDITPSMLLTLVLLHNWANWKTGVVRSASAAGLASWSCKAYHPNTFGEALRRLELMGHISRKMERGSHKDYPIVIHNYKVYDAVGKPSMINLKATRTWAEIQGGQCDETLDETVDETVEKVLSVNESQNEVGRWVGGEAECQPETQCRGIPEADTEAVSEEGAPVTEPVPPAKPEVPVREASPARALAERFFSYQGSPARLRKSAKEWTRRFGDLLKLYPDLHGIMAYAFETDEFWKDKLIQGSDPLGYFEKKLAVPEEEKGSIREKYGTYQARKAAARAREAAGPAQPPAGGLRDRYEILADYDCEPEETKAYLKGHEEEYKRQRPEWHAEFEKRGML